MELEYAALGGLAVLVIVGYLIWRGKKTGRVTIDVSRNKDGGGKGDSEGP